MFSLPRPKDSEAMPVIEMTEHPDDLEVLIRLIYPKRNKPSITITSVDHAARLLKAVDKLEIECAIEPIQAAIARSTEAEPNPVRAWAIATRFGIKTAIIAAITRYIKCGDEKMVEERVKELSHIDGLAHFDFINKRKDALRDAKIAILGTHWSCRSCGSVSPAWKKTYEGRIAGVNPFGGDVSSELLFEVCTLRSSCSGCLENFDSLPAIRARSILRSRLETILTRHSSI